MTRETKAKESSSGLRLKEIIEILGRYNLIHGLTPQKLRNILEDLGPTFVKLGQLLSMRPDMLPDAYCRELSLLRTEARPMAFGELTAVLENEYGRPYTDIFASLEEKPVGSASIAQVHAAVLKNGGSVVVKVQRPGIYERMDQDIKLLHKASPIIKIAGRTGNVIDFNAVLDEIWNVAKQEMDFTAEAAHIKKFTELNEGIKYVAFPRVEWAWTTPRVLCMERVDGIQIDDTDALAEAGYDLRDIAEKLVASYVKQVLDDGYFHADPHPGNIYIRDGRIVWLDLGMIGTLSSRERELFRKAVLAVADQNVYDLKAALLGISKHTGKINHTRLSEDIEELLNKYGSLELRSIDIGRTIMEMVEMADANGLSMPADISMLSRGIMTIEGVVSKIEPDTDVISLFSAVITKPLFEDFKLSEELERSVRLLYNIKSRSVEFSSDVMDILKLAAKGQSKVNVELAGAEETMSTVSRLVSRLIAALVDAAVLIGSSLLCLSDLRPTLCGLPLPGAIGFMIAALLSAWLVFDIRKKKR